MSKFSVGVDYSHKIGDVFLDDDHSESDLWVARINDSSAGTAEFSIVDHDGDTRFRRNYPDTTDYIAQAKLDLLEAAKAMRPTAAIVYDEDDTEDVLDWNSYSEQIRGEK